MCTHANLQEEQTDFVLVKPQLLGHAVVHMYGCIDVGVFCVSVYVYVAFF